MYGRRCPEYDMFDKKFTIQYQYVPRENITYMGFSLRVSGARYTEWRAWKPSSAGDWSPAGLVANELYNHTGGVGFGPSTPITLDNPCLCHKRCRARGIVRAGFYFMFGAGSILYIILVKVFDKCSRESVDLVYDVVVDDSWAGPASFDEFEYTVRPPHPSLGCILG